MDQDLFATETMAELCARQGRVAEAVAIYRRLLAGPAEDERRARWVERLQGLERAPAPSPDRAPPPAPPPPAPAMAAPAAATPGAELRLPLVVREPVRSGQVVYAAGADLIVLAPVNPGAQLLADGNIHVYSTLRGRAVAGAHGCLAARIFCQRLHAELVGIDAAYVAGGDIPSERLGKPGQVFIEGGRCVVAPLPGGL
jgi:septum site-determining protein MinC